jgi:hypothetical protein
VSALRAKLSRWRELFPVLAAALVLSVLGGALYLPHILHGGRWSDDWSMSATWALGPHSQLLNSFASESGRVLAGPYVLTVYWLFGLNTHLQLAWTCAMGVLMAWAVLAALTRYGLARRDALVVACLVLAFAPADAPRLWPNSGNADLAAALFLCGAAVAVGAFRTPSRRHRLKLHLGSLALYALSVMTYEAAVGAIALSVVGYRSVTSTRNAVRRWCADLAIVAWAVGVAAVFNNHASEPLGGAVIVHAAKLVAGAVLIASWAVFPVGAEHSPNVFRIIGALLIIGAVALGTLGARDGRHSRYWLMVMAGGVLFAMACYATYLPAQGYTPVGRGIANRTNILAEVGMVAAAYGAVQILAGAAADRWRASSRGLLVVLLTGLLALGYVAATVRDERAWDAAAHEQGVLLGRLSSAEPRPSPGTTLVVFGGRGFFSPGIPVFYAPWDLNGAAALRWRDRHLTVWPVTEGIGVVCGREVMSLTGPNFAGTHVGYGKLVFVDLRTDQRVDIPTFAACMRWPYRSFGVSVTS